MMWIIKENKKLFVIIVVTLLVSFIWYKFFISKVYAEAEDNARELASKKNELTEITKNGIVNKEDVSGMEGFLSNAREKLQGLRKDLMLNVENRFNLPKGEATPRVYFQQLLIREKSELDNEAVSKNVKLSKVANLGFSANIDDKQVGESLIRLSLVSKMIKLAIASGIKNIVTINPHYGGDVASIKEENFISTIDISVKVESPADSIVKFIGSLQKKENFMLVKSFSFRAKDSTVDDAEAELTLSGLIINEEGKVAIGESQKEQSEEKGFNWQKLSGGGNK